MANKLLLIEISGVSFDEQFKELFGKTFSEWKNNAKVIEDEEFLTLEDDNIYVTTSAYDNRWRVYERGVNLNTNNI